MAQAGFTPIQLFFSNTATNVPAALANGELAINQADGKLYYRNNSGVVTQLPTGGSGTVTSVAFSTGTTGLSVTGSPITTSGTITLAGILIAVNGGTGIGSYAQGEMLYANTTTTLDKVSANTTVTKKFLSQTGNGTAGLAPSWAQPAASDITGLSPSATTDTTNASNITSGTLGVSVGGTGQTTYTDGQLLIGNSTGNTLTKANLSAGSGITITNGSGAITISASGGGGTVTSVTGTSPVASSGGTTPDISLSAGYGDTLNPYASKTANFVLAAPDGTAGVPTFRALVATDVPTLNQNTTGTAAGLSATLAIGSGGTGLATTPTNGQLLIGNGTGYTLASLSAGSGITITPGAGTITIDATAGGGGTVTSVGMSVPAFLSISGSPITTSGTLAVGLSGTALPVANGGTGQTTFTDGELLIGNSTGNTLTKATLSAGSGISITNSTGSITIASTGGGGSVTSVAMSVPAFLSVSGSPITTSGTLAVTLSGTALPIANGGTGALTQQAAINALAGTQTNNRVLRSDGTNTTLSQVALGTDVSGVLPVANGGTAQNTYVNGELLIGNSTGNTLTKATLSPGTGISITNGTGSITIATSGVVTSVTGTTPVNSSGGTTPAISLASAYGDTLNPYGSKTANNFLAAPNGTAGVPTFRAILAADIPTLNQNTTGTAGGLSSTLAVTSGGTGQTTYTDGQLLIGNSTGNTLTKATLTQGTGITITNSAGAITIAASGGGGVTGFTTALNTAAPNATNNVSSITASGGTTNQFFAIIPKGTGGIIAGIPDSTFTGGNIRGTFAVDLQTSRSQADMVASGGYSVISGGLQNTASGNYAVAAGGELCLSQGAYSHTSGFKAQALHIMSRAHGWGAIGFAKGVDALGLSDTYNTPETTAPQASRQVLACKTTNATPTVLTADNAALASTNSHTIRANSIYYFTVYVAAGVTGAGNAKVWRLEGGIKRGVGVGTTALIGAVTKNVVAADAGASTWDVAVTADTTNGCLVVTGTGQAATSINWASLVTSVQTIFV
jgi:hypothetical protein